MKMNRVYFSHLSIFWLIWFPTLLGIERAKKQKIAKKKKMDLGLFCFHWFNYHSFSHTMYIITNQIPHQFFSSKMKKYSFNWVCFSYSRGLILQSTFSWNTFPTIHNRDSLKLKKINGTQLNMIWSHSYCAGEQIEISFLHFNNFENF